MSRATTLEGAMIVVASPVPTLPTTVDAITVNLKGDSEMVSREATLEAVSRVTLNLEGDLEERVTLESNSEEIPSRATVEAVPRVTMNLEGESW